MYLHPNNGLVPNNHLRSGRLMHQLTLFHMKPNKKSGPAWDPLSASAGCIYSFSHCALGPIVWCIVLCHLNALQCIGIWWECCVSSGDYWLPWNYLMELFISLDILYRRIGREGSGETRGREMIWILQMNSQWLWTIKTHDTFLFTSDSSWVCNHHLVCDC